MALGYFLPINHAAPQENRPSKQGVRDYDLLDWMQSPESGYQTDQNTTSTSWRPPHLPRHLIILNRDFVV